MVYLFSFYTIFYFFVYCYKYKYISLWLDKIQLTWWNVKESTTIHILTIIKSRKLLVLFHIVYEWHFYGKYEIGTYNVQMYNILILKFLT